MSFREKSAWISFVLLAALLVGYFVPLVHVHAVGDAFPTDPFHYVLALLVAFGVLQAALQLLLRWQVPQDARTPKDERERFIELKAARIGFYALVIGELLVLAINHLHLHFWLFVNTVMLAVLIAWLVKLGSEIVFHRKGG
jgi:hypothetical protein